MTHYKSTNQLCPLNSRGKNGKIQAGRMTSQEAETRNANSNAPEDMIEKGVDISNDFN